MGRFKVTPGDTKTAGITDKANTAQCGHYHEAYLNPLPVNFPWALNLVSSGLNEFIHFRYVLDNQK